MRTVEKELKQITSSGQTKPLEKFGTATDSLLRKRRHNNEEWGIKNVK